MQAQKQIGGAASIVAIHQPNFFPWIGYFDKIVRSDIFIFLDHVQFQKTGGTWSNRVKVLMGGEVRWITAPVIRAFHGVRSIAEIEFQNDNPWRAKLLKSIASSYSKAPFFAEAMTFLEPLILNPEKNLAAYNIAAITAITQSVGIEKEKFRRSSDFQPDEQSSRMLISLTRAVGGDIYMCGGGATGYQEDTLFAEEGLGLLYQDFQHPVYSQFTKHDFFPGLSIIDALMHCGVNGVKSLFQNGTKVDDEGK